jgi:hypothetical protein
MALVQIADVVVPAEFTAYVQVLTAQRNAFVTSGVVETNPVFNALLAGGGRTFTLPFSNDLADDEANISGDSPADVQVRPFPNPGNDSSPKKITTGIEVAVRHNRNQSWSSSDLAGQLAGVDPLSLIGKRVAAYWARQDQRTTIATIQGVIADNIANDSGDMVKDISTTGSITDANRFSAEAFIDACQTMGDRQEDLAAIAVHSVIYTRMKKLNLIDFIPDSQGGDPIPTYQGRRVIVDDGMPVFTDTNLKYSTYIFSAGVLAYGTGSPKVPTAVHRQELAGNGGGQEVLTNRRELIIAPRGFKYLDASCAGVSPTNTELKNALNWDRVFERKLCRIVELRTNA